MPKKTAAKLKQKPKLKPKPKKSPNPAPRLKPKPTKQKQKPKSPAKPKISIPAKSALLAILPKVSRAQFTANSQALLLSRHAKKTLSLYDIASASETPPVKALPNFTAAALSPDNRCIAMGTSSGILALQSTQTGKLLWKTKANRIPISDLAFTLDGSLLLAANAPDLPKDSPNSWLRAHKLPGGEPDTSLDPVAGALVSHLALSPDGIFLAHSEIHSNSVLLWHLPSRQMAACIRLNTAHGPITQLAFGLNIRHLFVAQHSLLSGWNGETGQNLFSTTPTTAVGPAITLHSLAVIDHGGTLVTTNTTADQATLEFWNAETGRSRKSIPLPTAQLGPLAASPDGKLLALPTTSSACWLWNAEKLVG